MTWQTRKYACVLQRERIVFSIRVGGPTDEDSNKVCLVLVDTCRVQLEVVALEVKVKLVSWWPGRAAGELASATTPRRTAGGGAEREYHRCTRSSHDLRICRIQGYLLKIDRDDFRNVGVVWCGQNSVGAKQWCWSEVGSGGNGTESIENFLWQKSLAPTCTN
jgi:hypothetical protein